MAFEQRRRIDTDGAVFLLSDYFLLELILLFLIFISDLGKFL